MERPEPDKKEMERQKKERKDKEGSTFNTITGLSYKQFSTL